MPFGNILQLFRHEFTTYGYRGFMLQGLRRMSKPKLTYFDAPISRGEECRLALQIAGVDFEDVRLTRDQWTAMKPTTPYGSVDANDRRGSEEEGP